MKAGSVWFGVVLVAVGLCGFLDAAGVVDSAQTIGQWWPLAIVGWPLVEMAAAKRVTLGGAICAAVGVTLLADVQAWAGDVVVWSSLAAFVGADDPGGRRRPEARVAERRVGGRQRSHVQRHARQRSAVMSGGGRDERRARRRGARRGRDRDVASRLPALGRKAAAGSPSRWRFSSPPWRPAWPGQPGPPPRARGSRRRESSPPSRASA